MARTRGNIVQDRLHPVLRHYRRAVPSILEKTATSPPPCPAFPPAGNTPAGVSASGTFLTPSNEAKVLHSLSPDPDITRYELRQCPPPATARSSKSTPTMRTTAGRAAMSWTSPGLQGKGSRFLAVALRAIPCAVFPGRLTHAAGFGQSPRCEFPRFPVTATSARATAGFGMDTKATHA